MMIAAGVERWCSSSAQQVVLYPFYLYSTQLFENHIFRSFKLFFVNSAVSKLSLLNKKNI